MVDAEVAVVTNIGRDHTDGRGDWRRAIAEEKAGIIKPGVPVIIFSGHGNIDTAVAAVGRGAMDFIEKPFEAERLLLLVERATETERLRRENSRSVMSNRNMRVVASDRLPSKVSAATRPGPASRADTANPESTGIQVGFSINAPKCCVKNNPARRLGKTITRFWSS